MQGGSMNLSKPMQKIVRSGYRPGPRPISGKFSAPANEPPAGGGDPGDGGGDDKDSSKSADEVKFTQRDLNRIGTKEKAEGKAAALREVAEQLGCTVEEAKAALDKAREAEDKTKSEAQRDREKAQQELAAAEKAKQEAAQERHSALIERALNKLGFTGKDEDQARILRMVTVEVGASYDDILADVTEVKASLNPELFGGKKSDGKGGPGRLAGGDPKGGTPKATGGEGAYAAGQKRFEERKAKRGGYDPTKQTA